MQNFDYHSPTRLIFGKDVVERLPEVLAAYGRRVLFAYGGGSIKTIGLYDKVKALLQDFEVYELGGIEANPKYDPSVVDGVRLCKEHDVDVVLAVGGGSVLDCAKAIAIGATYEGDTWEILSYQVKAKAALPIVDILTLAATGSEYDGAAVITNEEKQHKVAFMDPHIFPVCSILDPQYTFTVSAKQTAAGVADAMSHVFEQYFVEDSTLLNDSFCEGVLKSLMTHVHTVLKEPDNYEARAELMQACSYGCNGILALGNSASGWPCHGMEHALNALHHTIHGEGLAVITPRWMRYALNEKTLPRFVKFAVNVMGIDSHGEPEAIACQGIEALESFYRSIGLPSQLRTFGVKDEDIEAMVNYVKEKEKVHLAYVPLDSDAVRSIYKAAL